MTRGERRPRDRDGTEAKLLAAARQLLDRDGVLAGLNLQEVAAEADVNRGLVYRYFGSRKALLRAALADMAWGRTELLAGRRRQPFPERRRFIFEEALQRRTEIRLAALLAIDGEEDLQLFPAFDDALADLERDRTEGVVAEDADVVALHVATAACYLGYSIFREEIAREVGANADDLDARVLDAFDRMVAGLARRNRDE